MSLLLKNAAGVGLIFCIVFSSLQQVIGGWSAPPTKFSCAIGQVGLASLLPRRVTGWSAGTTASKVHGAAALLTVNALLPQETDALWSAGTTASKVQGAVALLATNALLNLQETEASFGGTCGYPSFTGCGANKCCGNQDDCGGLQNACDNGSINIHVGCYSCCGNWACTGVNGLRVLDGSCVSDQSCRQVTNSAIGSGSCIGNNSCEFVGSSTIGDGSCDSGDGSNACKAVTYSTIGSYSCSGFNACNGVTSSTIGDESCTGTAACISDGASFIIGDGSCVGDASCNRVTNTNVGSISCMGKNACYYCYEGNVPDNSCNNLAQGWGPGTKTADNNYSGYNNYCKFCRNCMDQNTGQSCYVTSLSATSSSSKHLSIPRGLKARGHSDQDNGIAECSALKDRILAFLMSVEELPVISQKLIGLQTKAKVIENKSNKPGDHCTIKWSFVSEHLGNKKELEAMCNALEAMFSQENDKFLNDNLSFADVVLKCDPKDLNANKGGTKKKDEKGKRKRKSSSKALMVWPLNV